MKKFLLTTVITLLATFMMASAIELDASYIVDDTNTIAAINEQKELQDTAHNMAEAARTLQASGVLKDHEASGTIVLAQAIWADSQTKIDELTTKLNELKSVDISFNPHTKTNLSAAAFNKMLYGTAMAGTGQSFEDMEQSTGTNGLFAIGVALSESGVGSACYNHNPYGILTSGGLKYFDSWGDATQYFGELIAGMRGVTSYKYANSVEAINAIYCPGDGGYWSSKVRYGMNTYLNKLA